MATTIKVSEDLRDRLNRDARARGMTAAGFIESLLDGHDRRRRMEAFGRSFRQAESTYWDEFQAWDVITDSTDHSSTS
ncbi:MULTISPECIES: ribbon-helix-helix protein [Kocuria]|uniref:Toxin-antitoxin system protein n=1 Tax=Kocuria subflava TaxID=1736139 RepID=A0A846TP25_9MICC|nr:MULTISPECIES: toxin-antitoxin system protein [Kocuria]NKE08559.1 toxin-antitoxin system protein [Kocuria subflava]